MSISSGSKLRLRRWGGKRPPVTRRRMVAAPLQIAPRQWRAPRCRRGFRFGSRPSALAIILRRHAKTGGLFPPLLCNRTLRPTKPQNSALSARRERCSCLVLVHRSIRQVSSSGPSPSSTSAATPTGRLFHPVRDAARCQDCESRLSRACKRWYNSFEFGPDLSLLCSRPERCNRIGVRWATILHRARIRQLSFVSRPFGVR